MDLLKAPRSPYQKNSTITGHLNLATEFLKGFSPSTFNRLRVTHSKSSNSRNLKPNSELIIFLFFKVTLKARVINLDS